MSRSVIGLDIGSSAVRAVEVSPGRNPRIRRAGRVALAPGVVQNGQVREPEEVTKAVRRLWHENKFSHKSVRLGIGSGSVLVRQVELDWMPPADLRKAMRYLVADLLPVPVDEANIDHVLLEESEVEERRVVRILLVATARDGVDEVVRAVQAAGLRPTTADLSPLGLVRAAARMPSLELPPGTSEAVVDVGAETVAVAVHTRGRPRFVRVIPGVGGSGMTQALAEASGEQFAAAEELKLRSSLEAERAPVHLAGDPVGVVLREAAERVVAEVAETLRFCASSDPENKPARVVLTGSGAGLPGFDLMCQARLQLPVVRLGADTKRRGTLAPDADPEMTVPFGLCLGGAA
jgi:type IV pilus assembly protein PilM